MPQRASAADLPGSVTEPTDPRTIGEFRVLRRLGEGSMGLVYLGQGEDGRRVALKVVRPEFARDSIFLRRFRDEAEHVRRVEAAYTARVIAAVTDAGDPYLVTEFIDGPTLDEQVSQNGPLPVWNAKAVAVGTAAALISIHDADVIHRDLKPSNVMLSRFGPRVIDFGIARSLSAATRVTHTGVLVGTPAYMSPEQIQDQEVTPASDVFSWAGVIVFAVTGHPPFGSPDARPVTLMFQIVEGQPNLAGVPPELREVIAAALSKDPAARPTPRQLLEHLIEDQPGGLPGVPAARASREPATGTRRLDAARWRLVLAESERIARTIADPDAQAEVLAEIATSRASDDPDQALRLLAEAEETARTTTDFACQAQVLAKIAEAIAAYDPVRSQMLFGDALRAARASAGPPGTQGITLGDVAVASAARNLGQAEQSATAITDQYRRSRALADIVETVVARDPDSAERIAGAITDPGSRDRALVSIASNLAMYAADRANRAAQAISGPHEKARAMAVMATTVTRNNPARAQRLLDDAEQIARTSVGDGWRQGLAMITVAAAMLPGDPARARRLLDDTELVAAGIDRPRERASLLEALTEVVATYDSDRAERIAHAITEPESQARSLTGIARQVAVLYPAQAKHLVAEARDTLGSITSPSLLAAAVAEAARGVAVFDPVRAAQFAAAINDPDTRTAAQVDLARLAAAADPARARDLLSAAEHSAAEIIYPVPQARALLGIAQAYAGATSSPGAAASGTTGHSRRQVRPEITRLLRGQLRAGRAFPHQFKGVPPSSLPASYMGRTIVDNVTGARIQVTLDTVEDLLSKQPSVLVTGESGLGKTTLTYQLAADLAAGWIDGATGRWLMPLRVAAAGLAAGDGALDRALIQAASDELSWALDRPLAEDLLELAPEGAQWLALIDGLGEIADPRQRRALVAKLVAHAAQGSEGFRVLITTGTLPQEELDQLSRSGIAFHWLAPFDHQQLEAFTQQWFSQHDGGPALVESIRLQFGHGLNDLFNVPLLAATAAIVHEQDPDRPVKGNRHALYERYLNCLARSRAPDTARHWNAVHDRLTAAPGSDKTVVSYLADHLTELVEYLAEQAASGDRGLLGAALKWADKQGASSVREHIPDWPELLCGIVESTGLFCRTPHGLRFVHSSIASHLASAAAARRLPPAFDPDDPDWAAVMHAAVQGDSPAVLVHHSHQQQSGNDMLTWLESGDVSWQRTAGELLAHGARADPSHIESFMASMRHLVRVSRKSYSSFSRELNFIATVDGSAAMEWLSETANDHGAEASVRLAAASAVARRNPAMAYDILRYLVHDPAVNALRHGSDAAMELADLGPQYTTEAANALESAIRNPEFWWDRREAAARRLTDLGPSFSEKATQAMLAVVSSRETDAYDRPRAAKSLLERAPEYKPRAVSALSAALADPGLHAGGRHNTARTLAELDPEYTAQAVRVMRALIEDPELDPAYRINAAETIYRLGPQYTTEAVQALRAIISDNTRGYRHWAAEALHGLGAQYRDEAAQALLADVSSAQHAMHVRISSAEMLVKIDPRSTEVVADLISQMLTDTSVTNSGKVQAAKALRKLSVSYHNQIVHSLKTIMGDAESVMDTKRWAAEFLAEIEPQAVPVVVEVLLRIATDAEAEKDWPSAAIAAARLDPRCSADAASALRKVTADPGRHSQDRVHAIKYLAALGPAYMAEAARTLQSIVADPAQAPDLRWGALEVLCALGPAHLGDAAWALRTFIADPATRSWWPEAIWHLARLDPHYASEAIQTLRKLASDPATRSDDKSNVGHWLTVLRAN